MQVGELFVSLGVKGADKTIGSVNNLKKGLGETKNMSLEMKAALIGAFYAFEQLMSASGKVGTDLTNFNALTGASIQELQKWQYATRLAGGSNEEMAASFKAVQTAMENIKLGKAPPEAMGLLNSLVGFDINKIDDTFYVIQKIQEAMQKTDKATGTYLGKSFGLSDNVISAAHRNMYQEKNFKQAPTYSNREVGSLDKAHVAWGELENKMQMAIGHFNAKHGEQLVGDISKLVDKVLQLAEAFMKVAESLKLFEGLGKVFDGWTKIFGGVTDAVNSINKEGIGKFTKDALDSVGLAAKGAGLTALDSTTGKGPAGAAIRPNVKPAGAAGGNTTIHQNIVHHGDAKDTHGVKQLHKQAIHQQVKAAIRQSPVQAGGI